MKLNTSFLKSAAIRLADATLAKLSQKSTVAGIVTFAATALGAAIEPGLAGTITTVGATVASALLVLFDEKVKPEAAPAVAAEAPAQTSAEVATPASDEASAPASAGEAH